MSRVTGYLKDAVWTSRFGIGDKKDCLYGRIYGDSKGRFQDGEEIYTSLVKEIKSFEVTEDTKIYVAITTYSTYFVEFKEGESHEPK